MSHATPHQPRGETPATGPPTPQLVAPVWGPAQRTSSLKPSGPRVWARLATGTCAGTIPAVKGHLRGQPHTDARGAVCAGPGAPSPISQQGADLASARVLAARAPPWEGDTCPEWDPRVPPCGSPSTVKPPEDVKGAGGLRPRPREAHGLRGGVLTGLSPQVGILLHYSTLATMLWIGVTARNIYKQVTKKAPPCPGADQPPYPRQPLLRYRAHVPGRLGYLLGVSASWLTGKRGPRTIRSAQVARVRVGRWG